MVTFIKAILDCVANAKKVAKLESQVSSMYSQLSEAEARYRRTVDQMRRDATLLVRIELMKQWAKTADLGQHEIEGINFDIYMSGDERMICLNGKKGHVEIMAREIAIQTYRAVTTRAQMMLSR